jgi:hypothetical protein
MDTMGDVVVSGTLGVVLKMASRSRLEDDVSFVCVYERIFARLEQIIYLCTMQIFLGA